MSNTDPLLDRMSEVTEAAGEIILFIDEMHTLVGAGKTDGAMDAANLIKPALARGELHCVGATTLDEYRKYVEKDAALARRFQPVMVQEPTVEDTVSILRGIKEKYELHHGVRISDSALVAAATLSHLGRVHLDGLGAYGHGLARLVARAGEDDRGPQELRAAVRAHADDRQPDAACLPDADAHMVGTGRGPAQHGRDLHARATGQPVEAEIELHRHVTDLRGQHRLLGTAAAVDDHDTLAADESDAIAAGRVHPGLAVIRRTPLGGAGPVEGVPGQ